MATRSCIVRTSDEGKTFTGVYHHWDGYPEGLGQTLLSLYTGHFRRDLQAMLRFLIDEHPAGWSTINRDDFNAEPGFGGEGPECYCHGAREEEPWVVTEENASGSGCEYAYAFDEAAGVLYVLSSYCETGGKMIGMFGFGDPEAVWKPIGRIDLAALPNNPNIEHLLYRAGKAA